MSWIQEIVTPFAYASFESRAEFCYRNMNIWSCATIAFACIGLLLRQNNSTGPGRDHKIAFTCAWIGLGLTITSLFLAIMNLRLNGQAELEAAGDKVDL